MKPEIDNAFKVSKYKYEVICNIFCVGFVLEFAKFEQHSVL